MPAYPSSIVVRRVKGNHFEILFDFYGNCIASDVSKKQLVELRRLINEKLKK